MFLRAVSIGSLAVFVIAWQQRDALPPPSKIDDTVLDEPLQTATDQPGFQTTVGGIEYSVRPVYAYDLHGLVVSKHNSDSWLDFYHEITNDKLNVADICVNVGGAMFILWSLFAGRRQGSPA